MAQNKINDLQAFVAVAHYQSFTKAAAKLGITPSALSHSMRILEERLGVRLLACSHDTQRRADSSWRTANAIDRSSF